MHCVAQEEIERLRALKNSPRSSPVDGDGWDEELRGFMELVPIRIDDLLPSKLPVRRASLLRRRRRECKLRWQSWRVSSAAECMNAVITPCGDSQ
jgi:hypothetical protein